MADNWSQFWNQATDEQKKEVELAVIQQSVVDLPDVSERHNPVAPIIWTVAAAADEFLPWGYDLKGRDAQLRSFWHTVPLLSSAVYGMAVHMAVLEWDIVGADPMKPRPRNTIAAMSAMLNSADRGDGWQRFIARIMVDVYTQDNGAFFEVIRMENKPTSPAIGVAHLDSFRCYRTGDPEFPVIYRDRFGREHKMPYWSVRTLEDMPSPIETMYGAAFCAVTRALMAAQIIRDIAIYKKEKVSGQFERALHLISGVTDQNIRDGLALAQEQVINKALTRYRQAPIIATIDPTAQLKHVQIDLASLPDGFDENTTLQWYVAELANAFGVDYQEFAPLPGGALGSSQQSEILHLKSRGKGPAMMLTNIENIFNNTGILPSTVKLKFRIEDARADSERAEARFLRGKDRALRVNSGELDIQAARELAVEDGDLPINILDGMEERPMPVKPPRAPDPLTVDQIDGGTESQNQ